MIYKRIRLQYWIRILLISLSIAVMIVLILKSKLMALPFLKQKTNADWIKMPNFNGGYNVNKNVFEIEDNEISAGMNIDYFPNKTTSS